MAVVFCEGTVCMGAAAQNRDHGPAETSAGAVLGSLLRTCGFISAAVVLGSGRLVIGGRTLILVCQRLQVLGERIVCCSKPGEGTVKFLPCETLDPLVPSRITEGMGERGPRWQQLLNRSRNDSRRASNPKPWGAPKAMSKGVCRAPDHPLSPVLRLCVAPVMLDCTEGIGAVTPVAPIFVNQIGPPPCVRLAVAKCVVRVGDHLSTRLGRTNHVVRAPRVIVSRWPALAHHRPEPLDQQAEPVFVARSARTVQVGGGELPHQTGEGLSAVAVDHGLTVSCHVTHGVEVTPFGRPVIGPVVVAERVLRVAVRIDAGALPRQVHSRKPT